MSESWGKQKSVCHMKQNCHFQRSMAQCKHATTPLSSYSINTTLQGFQKRYITLLYLKGLKRYQQKCKWKVRFTKESGVKCRHLNFWWLVTFEPLEIQVTFLKNGTKYLTKLTSENLKNWWLEVGCLAGDNFWHP